MEGLAKSAQSVQPVAPVHNTPQSAGVSPSFGTTPMELYRYFQVDPINSDKREHKYLSEIYSWAKEGSRDVGDAFLKIQQLRNVVGVTGSESLHIKMYNKILVDRAMGHLIKEKQDQKDWEMQKFQKEERAIKKQRENELKALEAKRRKKEAEINNINKNEIAQLKKISKSYELGGR